MVQFEAEREGQWQDKLCRDLRSQECRQPHPRFIESPLCFCCYSRHTIYLAMDNGTEWMAFFLECASFTVTYRREAARAGTCLRLPDSLPGCFICSRRYWHGS